MTEKIDLERIRKNLIRLEDNIIISLFNRTQFKLNNKIYISGAIEIPNFDGSFLDYLFRGTEKLHASAGRYIDQEEHVFYLDTPQTSIIPRKVDDIGLQRRININQEIMFTYLDALPSICEEGDDNKYGSAAIADITCLQHLSRRIHMGEQVAEAKFQDDPEEYKRLIKLKDVNGLMEKLTNREVEKKILERVKLKGERYYVDPQFISNFYENKIMPLTKEVEIEYFMKKEQ